MRKIVSTIVVFFLRTALFGQTLHTLHSDEKDVMNIFPELENVIIITRNGIPLAAFQDAIYPMTQEFVDEINRCYPDDSKALSEKGYDGETLTDGYFESFVTITVRIIQDADGNIIHILEGDDFKKFFE